MRHWGESSPGKWTITLRDMDPSPESADNLFGAYLQGCQLRLYGVGEIRDQVPISTPTPTPIAVVSPTPTPMPVNFFYFNDPLYPDEV